MDWTDWVMLAPPAFERRLRRRLAKPLRYNDLIALYNHLMMLAGDEPERVAAIAVATAWLFKRRKLTRESLLFLELSARCHFIRLDADQGFAAIEALIDADPVASREIALEMARSVHADMDTFGSSIDQRPRILAGFTSILHRYGELEELADVHLEAAMLYSRHNATQAAYRSVNDAEMIAREIRSLPLMARTYSTAAAVACEENDFEWSIKAARRAVKAYRLSGVEPPVDLLSNLGVARMNLDQLELAVANFRAALERMPEPGPMRAAVKVNLAASLRRLDDFEGAEAELAAAEIEATSEMWPDNALELAFGWAKLAEARGDASRLVKNLRSIAERLDTTLAEILRLHHRRGVRERYIERIERLLRALPDHGAAEDALLPLVAARGSAFGDWLAILAWSDHICERSEVPPALVDELKGALIALRGFGAPHLYGFREKYDDAWSPGNFGRVWDTLSQIGGRLDDLKLPRPTEMASSERQASVCSSRLQENHCLMAMTYAGDDTLLWYFIGDRYGRVSINHESVATWEAARLRYAAGEINRPDFITAIEALASVVGPITDAIFAEIADAGCLSVRSIQDFGAGLPLTLLALRNEALADRMEAGDFEVRVLPALHAPLRPGNDLPSAVAAIIDPEEELILAPFEGAALASAAGLAPPTIITADREDGLATILADHDVLIVSTHGHSLEFFTDAYFARLGTPGRPHPIRVETLQRIAPDLNLRLAILNTCYSGSASARNFQQRFRTSDAVAIPSLFLLNRRAVAVAGSWKISDTASFMFASLIGRGLKRGLEPSAALASAIARLRKLTKTEAIEILEGNVDPETREKVVDRISGAPDAGMFSHPYFAGGLMIHGLL